MLSGKAMNSYGSCQNEIKIIKQEKDSDETNSDLSTRDLLLEKDDEFLKDNNNTGLNDIVKDEVDLVCDAKIKIENMAFLNEKYVPPSSSNEENTLPSFEEVIIKEERTGLGQDETDNDKILSVMEFTEYEWCVGCRKRFQRSAGAPSPAVCKICGRTLRRVVTSSTKDKPYACNICMKQFRAPSILTIHMRTHTDEKPHECRVCTRTFSQLSSMRAHMRTHTAEKPFKCQVCDRCFSRSSNVVRHMRTHTDERPYRCHVCGSMFSDSSNFTAHSRTHSNVKLYECKVCGKMLSRSTSVTAHMRTHIREKRCHVGGGSSRQVSRHQMPSHES